MNKNYVDYVNVNEELRLVKYDEKYYSIAEEWYKDKEILYYSEGKNVEAYDRKKVEKMYSYLSTEGELYFIQAKDKDGWVVIGDVSLLEDNMPIAIGDKAYWNKGVGRKAIKALIEKGKSEGRTTFRTKIYYYNDRSKAMFKSLGFQLESKDDKEEIYVLNV